MKLLAENEIIEFSQDFLLPKWLEDCPILDHSWVTYGGKVYCAWLNYEESQKLQQPVFNLAYCITKAMNHIWLKENILYKRKNIKLTHLAN